VINVHTYKLEKKSIHNFRITPGPHSFFGNYVNFITRPGAWGRGYIPVLGIPAVDIPTGWMNKAIEG
jgi:hypothetical protein